MTVGVLRYAHNDNGGAAQLSVLQLFIVFNPGRGCNEWFYAKKPDFCVKCVVSELLSTRKIGLPGLCYVL